MLNLFPERLNFYKGKRLSKVLINSIILDVKNLFLLFLSLALLACGDQNEKPVPPGVLSVEQMAAIQVDIHIAESKAIQSRRGMDTTQAIYMFYRQEILKKHKVDTATYNSSFRYYSGNIKLMDKIYETVVDSLGLRETQGRWD